MINRLVRMRAVDPARLQGKLLVLIDGTGHLAFDKKHCDHCLVYKHKSGTRYLHQVLEAKLLGPGALVFSMGSAFIENADAGKSDSAEQRKQDSELAAFDRLARDVKRDFPQAQICVCGDSQFACGRALLVCKNNRWSYQLAFKPGRTPALYAEFEQLLKLSPGNELRRETAEGAVRVYNWVVGLDYVDSQGRKWKLNALRCRETVARVTTTFAWITDLKLTQATVEGVAQGARERWRIENEGFNCQNNSEMRLEHVYSTGPQKLKAYYLLLQIAHTLIQLLQGGSLLRRMAAQNGKTPLRWLGSQKNVGRRLLEGLRFGDVARRPEKVGQIRLVGWDTS